MDVEGVSRDKSNAIKTLCRHIEECSGIKANSPGNFDTLADAIFHRTGEMLSPTTLKRVFGYINEQVSTRRSTLDILARFCGWQSFEDFASGNIPEIESGTVGTRVLSADVDVLPGNKVRLMWPPSRVCIIEYLGDKKWRVTKSEGTRLSAGDTFSCPMIITGEPMYLDKFEHQGTRPGVYVCGRKSGVTFCIENDND